MAYSDSGDSVRKTAGTIATVWIIVIVVLVVLSVAGCIVAVWMWRRHVRRRRQRMDAFYATPIQNGPQQQQYPNYSYQQVHPKQEQQRPQHPVSEIYTPNSPQPPPAVAQLDGQHTEVGSISHRSSYSPLPAQLDAQPTGVSSNGSNHNSHPTNNHSTNTNNNHNNMNNQPPSELP